MYFLPYIPYSIVHVLENKLKELHISILLFPNQEAIQVWQTTQMLFLESEVLMEIVIKASFTEIHHIYHRQAEQGKAFLTSSNSNLFFSSRLVYLL